MCKDTEPYIILVSIISPSINKDKGTLSQPIYVSVLCTMN